MAAELRFRLGHQIAVPYLLDGSSLDAVERYARAIAAYSNAALTYCAWIAGKSFDSQERSGEYANVGFQAKVQLQAQTENIRRMVIIPAPVSSLFETQADGRPGVKQATGEQIAAAYSQLSGKTFAFTKGVLWGDVTTY